MTVVVARKVGRLANRLLLFAHFIGTAVEYGFRVVNPAFCEYAHYFPATAGDLLCNFPKTKRPIPPIGYYSRGAAYRATFQTANCLHLLRRCGLDTGIIRLRREDTLDLDGEAFLAAIQKHRVLFVQDWFFRSSMNCEKHGGLIREFLRPWDTHMSRARELADAARKKGSLLVGVHVRQGDYRRAKGGRFYYSHDQYRRVMDQVESVFGSESVCFLVCSDEYVPRERFRGLDVSYGNGHELEDLYGLAYCDRLIGPPSTYGKWASFYGAVPRYEITDPEMPVRPESFRVASRLTHNPFDGDSYG